MNRAVLTEERRRPDGRGPSHRHGPFATWVSTHNTALTVAVAVLIPVAYLLYLIHFAINVPFVDDWFSIRLVHETLHGQLTLATLWRQYNNSRIFLGRLIFIIFGLADHYDVRAVIFFNAVVLTAAYALVLVVYSRYTQKRLTPLPVAIIGIIWFSIADVENALWAFQLSWYLVLLFLAVMLYAFFIPNNRQVLWLAVAALAAFGASVSSIQGFVLWPLGLLCIVWHRGWARRSLAESVVWVGAALASVAIYLPGYNTGQSNCLLIYGTRICSTSFALDHPWVTARYMFVLMGSVLQSYPHIFEYPSWGPVGVEWVGAVMFAVCIFIAIQSIRHRSSSDCVPLPLALITFGFLFDLTIALGRVIWGVQDGLTNRYIMPNIVLLTGIVIYGLARIPRTRTSQSEKPWSVRISWMSQIALAAFLVVQVGTAMTYGVRAGQLTKHYITQQARIVVNLDDFPADERACELSIVLLSLWTPADAQRVLSPIIKDAQQDRLSLFNPTVYREYLAKGPPPVDGVCVPR